MFHWINQVQFKIQEKKFIKLKGLPRRADSRRNSDQKISLKNYKVLPE